MLSYDIEVVAVMDDGSRASVRIPFADPDSKREFDGMFLRFRREVPYGELEALCARMDLPFRPFAA